MPGAAPGTPQTGLRAFIDMTNFDAGSNKLIATVNKMNSALGQFAANTSKSFSQANSQVNNMASMGHRIESIVGGILVADIFRGIARGLREMTTSAFEAVSQFQALQIQLETIAARNYAHEFGVPVSEAFTKISGQAEELLYWIRQVAVTTPFSVEQLGNAFALSQAYGFTTESAKRLIMATGNFTAAMGLSDEVLKRIIYNMGQMVAQGKPTGRELRDLSNSFVPINDIAQRFADRLGTSKAAVIEMFRTGQISAREFINEFEIMVEEDFPNAMERMSRTFVTVGNNIKDFFQSLVGYEVFGPVADKISGSLQDALTAALSPESYRTAAAAGQAILYVYDRIAEVIPKAAEAVNQFFSILGFGSPTTLSFAENLIKIGIAARAFVEGFSSGLSALNNFITEVLGFFNTSFQDLSRDMFAWGNNVILAFARGLAAGIGFVVDALIAVVNTIASFLEAHSPPKMLPDLPEWGAAAMDSYMEGWKAADFSVFNDIQGLIEKAIMSLKVTGKAGNETSLIESVIGSTDLIADAVEQYRTMGKVSDSVLQGIASSVGFAGEQIKKFVTLALDASKFQEIADAINDMFSFKGVGQVNIFGSLVDSFEDIRSIASQFGSDLSSIVLAYANDAEDLVEVNERIAESQEEINRVTKYYDNILSELNNQLTKNEDAQEDLERVKVIDKTLASKILTVDERKRLELEKEQILLKRQIRDTETAKDKELGAIQERMDAYEKERDELEKRIENEKEQLKSIATARAEAAKEELAAIQGIIEAQIKLNELASRKIQIDIGTTKSGSELADDFMEEFGNGLSGAAGKLKDNFDKAIDDLWVTLKDQWDKKIAEWTAPFQPLVKKFEELKTTLMGVFGSKELQTLLDEIGAGFTKAFKPFLDFWDKDGAKISEAVGRFFAGLVANAAITNPVTGKSLIQIIQESIQKIGETLSSNGPAIKDFLDKFSDFINNKALPALKGALEFIGTELIPALINFAVQAAPAILGILNFLVDNSAVLLSVFMTMKELQALGTIGTILATIGKFSIPTLILSGALLTLNYTLVKFGGAAATTGSQIIELFKIPGGGEALAKGIFTEEFWNDFWKATVSGPAASTAASQISILYNIMVSTLQGEVVKGLSGAGSGISGWISQAQSDVGNFAIQAGLDINTWTTGVQNDVGAMIVASGPAITNWCNQAGLDIFSWTSQTSLDFDAWTKQAQSDVVMFTVGAGTAISTWTSTAWSDIKTWTGKAATDISGWATQAGKDITKWANQAEIDITNWSTQAGSDIKTWSSQAVTDILSWTLQAGIDISEWATQAGRDITTWTTNAGTDISGWVTQAATDISTWVTNAGADISTWATNAGTDISGWATQAATDISSIGPAVSDILDNLFGEKGTLGTWIATAASTIYTAALDIGTSLINGFLAGVGSLWDKFVAKVEEIAKTLKIEVPTPTKKTDDTTKTKTWHYEDVYDPTLNDGTGGYTKKWVYSKRGSNFIVPSRFVNDSLGMLVGAGERVQVTPAEKVGALDRMNKMNIDLLNGIYAMLKSTPTILGNSANSYGLGSTVYNTYDQRVTIEVNPTYSEVVSPAGIYNDVTAALAAAWR